MDRQIGVGDSKYGIFDNKFLPVPLLAPKFPISALQYLFLSLKHTVPVIIDAHLLQTFYTTWVLGVAYQKHLFGPKLTEIWAKAASKHLAPPI